MWWCVEDEVGSSPISVVEGWGHEMPTRLRQKRRAKRLFVEAMLSRFPGFAQRTGVRFSPWVLCYHNVVLQDDLDHGTYVDRHLAVSLSFLERQVVLLSRLSRVVLARDVERTPMPWGDHQVVLTFDDGFRSVYKHARPLLKHCGVKATIFANGSTLDGASLWYDLLGEAVRSRSLAENRRVLLSFRHGKSMLSLLSGDFRGLADRVIAHCKRFPRRLIRELLELYGCGDAVKGERLYMSPGEYADWLEEGHEVGGHTMHHMILPAQGYRVKVEELRRNREVLRGRLGVDPVSFAYPNGNQDKLSREAVKAARYTRGFSVEDDKWVESDMAIRRRNISDAVCVDENGRFHGGLFVWWLLGAQYKLLASGR